MSNVYINKLSLGSVFPQSNVGRANKRSRTNGYASDVKLPNVITIYSPSDPVTLCERYNPSWIAIDCSDKNQLGWVEPLLAYAREKALPVIAWMTNPLSSLIHIFERHSSSVVFWPQIDKVPCRDIPLTEALYEIFAPPPPIDVQPIILEVESKNPYWENLLQAYRQLSHLTKEINRSGSSLRLARITVGVAWRTLRALEGMIVPLELYETESKNIWGVNSISDSLQTMKSYLSNLQTLSTANQGIFQTVYEALQSVHQYLQEQTPPLWDVLVDVCLEESHQRRTLVFTTKSARDLFSLALLSYHNITEDDLNELGIQLTSLKRLYGEMTHPDPLVSSTESEMDEDVDLVLIGLPSHHNIALMAPMLKRKFSVLLLDYQLRTLERKVIEWSEKLFPSPSINYVSVETALGLPKRQINTPIAKDIEQVAHRLGNPIRKSIELSGVTSGSHRVQHSISLSQEYDVVQELTYLMGHEDPREIEYSTMSNQNPHAGQMVDSAWEVCFSNGMSILFATDDMVNVIASKNGKTTTDERYVSSLRSGDRVLYISGQNRQSLYELLISRVYDNPAISLHVKLVERWHEEFVKAHNRRKRIDQRWSLDKLFDEMRLLGTSISDTQPLRNWLKGETLRPQDPEDLRRLAEIFRLEFVKQHYKRIHKAGGRLHGLNVSLSRRLNSWLQDGTPDLFADSAAYEDTVDEDLGLTLRDFMNSVMILTVTSKQEKSGPFIRDTLGQIEKRSKDI